MFLDLRYNLVLSQEETERAKEHFINTWIHITRMESLHIPTVSQVHMTSNDKTNSDTDEIWKLDESFREK